jgi:uncharacterized protein involved in exopolysaccharide biosynthesis/Mrp family chromosome partitioning ATPase
MKDTINIQEREQEPQGPGMTLGDIYYVLFRHKWKILIFSLAGIVAAGIIYLKSPSVYQSEAKLLIRYILDSKSVGPINNDSQIQTPDSRGETIINSEMEILTSLDLAGKVADAVGPEKILGQTGLPNARNRAAALVLKGLDVDAPRKGTVIRVIFRHPDSQVVQPVVHYLIDSYLKKHVEIHQALGLLDDILAPQTDQIRTRLAQTESDLRRAKTNAGVISLDDSKRGYAEQIATTKKELYSAEAELEEHKAIMKELEKFLPAKSEAAASEFGSSVERINEYKDLCTQLDSLRKKENELKTQFTEENPVVKRVRGQILESEKQKKTMEEENPKLAKLDLPSSGTNGPAVDVLSESSRVAALEAKIRTLNSQLVRIRADAAALDELESFIITLQRKKDLEESNYKFYSTSLEQARIAEAFGAGKVSNINVVQAESPPSRDASTLKKPISMALVGGLLVGVGLAFLLELFLDQSVKRPGEVEARLRLPLFLSIPNTQRTNGHFRFRNLFRNGHLRQAMQKLKSGSALADQNGGQVEIAPWDPEHGLRSYYEALRDRLVTHFEVRSMTHKPKLVAVTSCSDGSGVTTIATGLAAALSETGDGNVLLVDMNLDQGAAHAFHKGKPGCGLPEVLDNEKRDAALVQENLYMVSARDVNGGLPKILARRFSHLMPQMKASDYDYIIFDMPPVNQTSVTPRLASHMDMVLMVVESQKTNREVAKRAGSLLSESKAYVAAILNKNRTYVPAWLHPEF